MTEPSLIDTLRRIVGDARCLVEPAEAAPYCTDWRGRYQGQALAVVLPGNTEEVARVVAACTAHGVAVVPQGGNTGLVGGATPMGGEVVVNLTRMNRIRHLDTDNSTLTVDAGCTLQQIQQAAAAADRLFPLSLASEGSATIGGNLATNAGGVQVLRYGNTRDLALGLEVVLADGQIWNGLTALRKNNTGYDLKHLFIGAEGTLGVITGAVLKLFPRPQAVQTAWASVASPAAAIALLNGLRRMAGDRVTAFELVGRPALDLVLRHVPGSRDPLPRPAAWQVLMELSDTDPAAPLNQMLEQVLQAHLGQGLVLDAAIAASEAQAEDLWRLRENISESQKRQGISIKHDISLPVSRLPEFIQRAEQALSAVFPALRIVCFGHVGDGNLHFNLSRPLAQENDEFIVRSGDANRIVHDLVADLGGAISAEHGLGQLKRQEIRRYKQPVELEMMLGIKKLLDPHGTFNPGKVI